MSEIVLLVRLEVVVMRGYFGTAVDCHWCVWEEVVLVRERRDLVTVFVKD